MRLRALLLAILVVPIGSFVIPMAAHAQAGAEAPISGAFARPGATRRRSGNVIFDLPAGWEAVEMSLGEDDLPATSVRVEDWYDRDAPMVTIPRGTAFSGDDAALGRWGEALLARCLDLDDDETFSALVWTPVADGAIRLLTGGGTVLEDGQPAKAVLATISGAAGRADLAYVEVPLGDPDTLQARMREASDALTGAVGTFAFVSAGAPPLLPAPVPGPYDGLRRGSSIAITLGPDMMMQTNLVTSSYVFSRDGTFARGIPDGGMGVLSDPDLAMILTATTGNYRVEGDRVRLLYADGSEDTLEIDGAGDLSDGQATLYPTDVPADGFTFDGTAASFSYTGLPSFDGPVGGSGVASSSATVFRRDGTFSRQRSTAVNGNTSAVSYGSSNESASDGTYRIRGGELAMVERGTGGGVRRGEVVVLDEGDGPSLWWGTTRIELAPGQTIPRAGPPAPARMPSPGTSTDVASVPQSVPATNPLARSVNPLAAPVNPLASAAPTPLNPLSR